MTRRKTTWSLAISGAAAVAGGLTVALLVRPPHIKARIERAVSARLHLEATIGSLSVHFGVHAVLEADAVTIRVPDRPDLPPFIAIDRLTVEATPIRLANELVRGHVQLVHVDGLRITIPPGDDRHTALRAATRGSGGPKSRVIIDQLVAHDATLTIMRRRPGHAPLVFDIHSLDMSELGFERPIPFHAELRNPIPTGDVVSDGTLGPWQTAPSDLPLEGNYTFRNADLDTIRGIGGMLTSDGHYAGTLNEIRVVGRSETPDFNLDMGGKPVPLRTTFTATVNGSNGTTRLESVEAMLFHTTFHVSGSIVNLPGPAGFEISLKADVAHGRIEDVLALAMDTHTAPFTGDVSMHSTVHLPFGNSPVRDRLEIDGQFGLEKTRFTDGRIEQQLEALSRRGQGKDEDAPAVRVVSNVGGHFHLAARQVSLPDLTFDVPGATVALTGTYGLPTQQMDFDGQLQMEASLSDAVGGFKSIFIKPFDWLFRRDGHGSVIPISIEGTRDHPKFTVRIGAALTRGK